MTKITKLVWRLSKLPSVDELQALVKDKIITQDEAREILFSSEEVEERDNKSLKEEIKFLRELVEKLAKSRSQIVEVIREVQPIYYHSTWTQPYTTWCNTTTDTLYLNGGTPTFTNITTF